MTSVFAPYTPDQMSPQATHYESVAVCPIPAPRNAKLTGRLPVSGYGTQLEVKRSPGVESSYFYSVGDSTSRIYPVVQFNSLDGVNVNISHNGDH